MLYLLTQLRAKRDKTNSIVNEIAHPTERADGSVHLYRLPLPGFQIGQQLRPAKYDIVEGGFRQRRPDAF